VTRVNLESKAKKNKTIKYNITNQQENTNRKLQAITSHSASSTA
jgi:hypothetical protein